MGAAYLLTDRAYAGLSGGPRELTVRLVPKSAVTAASLKQLAADFLREHESQLLRWEIARRNQPIREHIAEQAVLAAAGRLPPDEAAAPAAAEELNDEQRKEIEKLIAEVEAEIQVINQKKAVSDPKKISASWEHAQDTQPREKRP